MRSYIKKAKSFYEKNEKRLEVAFFFFGFFFDIFTIERVDNLLNILHQALYLFLLCILILAEVRYDILKTEPPKKIRRFWPYRNLAIHFLLGTLLNTYAFFFFKSSSFLSSFSFLIIVASLIVLNELPQFRNLGLAVRVVLWSLCFGSFLAVHTPTLFGFMGWIPFTWAMVLGSTMTAFIFKRIKKWFSDDKELKKTFLYPSLGTYCVFFILYMAKAVPPVPLSLEKIGIYHKIEKQADDYLLYFNRSKWRFWQNGAQTFGAEPGDKIHCFISVFAPTRIKDQIFLKWYFDDPKNGWMLADSIPVQISGGRERGFRGYGAKTNFSEGEWQVRVVTTDDRELGRISFTVENEQPDEFRRMEIDRY